MPQIGRMQALSSANSDIFWLHKAYLSFWQCLEKYLVTMDPNFETLIPSNFVPWLLHTFYMLKNIDMNIEISTVKIFPMLRAEQTILKPSINRSLHAGSTGDVRAAGSTGDTRGFFWLEGFQRKAFSKAIVTQNQQLMNVDENGSFVQNMAFFLSGKGAIWPSLSPCIEINPILFIFQAGIKVKMTIREPGQSLKTPL